MWFLTSRWCVSFKELSVKSGMMRYGLPLLGTKFWIFKLQSQILGRPNRLLFFPPNFDSNGYFLKNMYILLILRFIS